MLLLLVTYALITGKNLCSIPRIPVLCLEFLAGSASITPKVLYRGGTFFPLATVFSCQSLSCELLSVMDTG